MEQNRVGYETRIFEALGMASMCWDPRPGDAVFDSEQALKVGNELVEQLEKDVPLGVVILSKALEDPGYYMAWQANIAMAFKDEFDDKISLNKEGFKLGVLEPPTKEMVHEIANNAAKRFLDMFLYKPGKEDGEESRYHLYSELVDMYLKGQLVEPTEEQGKYMVYHLNKEREALGPKYLIHDHWDNFKAGVKRGQELEAEKFRLLWKM